MDISDFKVNKQKAADLNILNQLLIDGEFVDAQDKATIDVIAPHNGEVICLSLIHI